MILFDRDQETGGARNIVSPAQVTTLVADLRAAAGDRPIIVSVDQEGGIVTRLSPAHGFPAGRLGGGDRPGDGRRRRDLGAPSHARSQRSGST